MGRFIKRGFNEDSYQLGSKYVETRDNKNPGYNGYVVEHPSYYNVLKWDTIRVPSLKRKSAWKRFYKLYPELKGQKIFKGRSRSNGLDFLDNLRDSYIPLKKI